MHPRPVHLWPPHWAVLLEAPASLDYGVIAGRLLLAFLLADEHGRAVHCTVQ
jgi:hypothetical protein